MPVLVIVYEPTHTHTRGKDAEAGSCSEWQPTRTGPPHLLGACRFGSDGSLIGMEVQTHVAGILPKHDLTDRISHSFP